MSDYPDLPIIGDTVAWKDSYAGHGTFSGRVVKCDDDGVLVSVAAYGTEPCFKHIPYTKIIDVRTAKVKS